MNGGQHYICVIYGPQSHKHHILLASCCFVVATHIYTGLNVAGHACAVCRRARFGPFFVERAAYCTVFSFCVERFRNAVLDSVVLQYTVIIGVAHSSVRSPF